MKQIYLLFISNPSPSQKVLKSDLKKSHICPLWGQSKPLLVKIWPSGWDECTDLWVCWGNCRVPWDTRCLHPRLSETGELHSDVCLDLGADPRTPTAWQTGGGANSGDTGRLSEETTNLVFSLVMTNDEKNMISLVFIHSKKSKVTHTRYRALGNQDVESQFFKAYGYVR